MSATSSPCTPDTVRERCEKLGFRFSGEISTSLCAYLTMLVKWNKVMNLVGRTEWEDVLARLVADSFHLADLLDSLPLPESPECWDLGSGAGLPGIPLRMLWQKGHYTLVEAREKRALFLRTVLSAVPLPETSVFQGRVETFMPQRPCADLIVSRAFMPWQQLLALVEKYTVQQGFCVILALEPLPRTLPGGWTSLLDKHYTICRDTRFFWVLRKESRKS